MSRVRITVFLVRHGDPGLFTLKALGGERLALLLALAKGERYYTMPWPGQTTTAARPCSTDDAGSV